jgi:hypothetical protein
MGAGVTYTKVASRNIPVFISSMNVLTIKREKLHQYTD